MVNKKKLAIKLISIALSIFMVLSTIPMGLFTTAFAAAPDCMAVEVNGIKVYFYGVETLEVDGNTVKFTGGDGNEPSVYVDGNSDIAIDDGDIVIDEKVITFSPEWLSSQTAWIGVQCDADINVTYEPSVEIDNTAPVIDADSVIVAPMEWTKDFVTITVTATDDITGVVAYSIDNVNWQDDAVFNVSENALYKVYAKDAVGNVSEGTDISISNIDNISPTLSSVTIAPDTWTNEDITFIVNAEDNESGLAESAYRMDDGEWQESNRFTVSDSDSHTFVVRDTVGNEAKTTQKADKHDVIKPEITDVEIKFGVITIDPNEMYTSPHIYYDFYITASDDKSGVAEYSKDGINWQSENKFTLKGADNYTFYVKDNAGNISLVKDISLKGDITPPTIESIVKSENAPTNQAVTITVHAKDNDGGSGLAKQAYKIDNGRWQQEETFTISDSYPHTVYVRDSAHPENIVEQEIIIDNFCDEIPTIENIILSTDEWTNSTVIATVNANGTTNNAGVNFEIVEYKMDNGEWQLASAFEINDCNTHKFYVKDEAGNISLAFEKAVVNYDNNTPLLEDGIAVKFDRNNSDLFSSVMNKLTFGRFFNKQLVITVDAKDTATDVSNVSGIVSATFRFIDVKESIYEFEAKQVGNSEKSKIQFVIEKADLPEDFKGTAEIILVDKAGNSNTIQVTTGNSDMGELADNASDFNFIIENCAPTVDSIIPSVTPVESTYKSDYTVDFTVSDKTEEVNNSGIARAKIEVNGTLVNEVDFQDTFTDNQTISVVTNAVDKKVNDVAIDNWNDGELKYVITVVDNAGNETVDSRVYRFDQTAPQITGFSFDKADDGYYQDENKFTDVHEAVSVTDYGFYFKNTVEVTIIAEDIKNDDEAVASGLKSVTVYLKDVDGTVYVVPKNNSVIQKSENNDVADAVAIETTGTILFTIPQDFKGQIYAFAADCVDNSPISCRYKVPNDTFDETIINQDGFVHPDGSIVETEKKHTETSSIAFINVPTAQGTQNNTSNYSYSGDAQKDKFMDFDVSKKVPLYNKDINFGVKVTDIYSGIREIKYTIIEGNKEKSETVTLNNEGEINGASGGWTITETDSNLVTEMTNTITVSGNYNDMVLLIELTDRAGNKSYDYYVFGIDKTIPTITVTYDNNNADTQSGTGSYFRADRIATILVQERNFNTENVKFTIKNAEGTVPKVVAQGIVTKDTDGNGDGNIYKYVVSYNADGVYTFDVEYTDRAANKASVDYKNSVAPKAFILDKTLPTITVSYDNNDAQNEKFFKADRTATITVVEHNFDVNRVVITQTSLLSGNTISDPSVSWVNSGDIHVGTIHYNVDGDYTFDITMTDKAGNKESSVNYGSSVAAKDFTIDTAYSDIVKVEGIADKGILGLINGDIDENAKINITINDVNLDNYNIKLTRSRVLVIGESDEAENASQENVVDNQTEQAENGVDVTSNFVTNASGSENTTSVISIPKRDENGVKNDGLYTLEIEAKDKAGNAYDTDRNVITFSVNRFGSVFTFSDSLYKLLNDNDGYAQSVSSTDLTVYEYNTTEMNDEKVEIIANNESKTLAENTDYTVNTENQQDSGSWNKNTYKIKPENFKNDGVYTLRLSSRDTAFITSQTVDYDICSATFKVDSTPADIISVNYSTEVEKMLISDAASAKTDKLTVNFTVEDLIRLEKIEVYINDVLDKTYTYGEDFDDANTFDGGQFVISDGGVKTQNFRIVVTDKAGNVIDTSNKDDYKPGYVFFDQLVVSPNAFIQFYANKALFWGSIAGIVLTTGIIIFIVVKKRKKYDDDQPEQA